MSYEYSNKSATLDLTGSTPGKTMNPSSDSRDLERNCIGIMGIVFFVIAAAAPLTVVVALFPVIIGSGNGIGIAGAFVAVALVLLLFAVGYVAMSKHITNAGAFYAYITKGVGRPMGLGSASLAIFSYNAIQLGLYGGIGYYLNELLGKQLNLHLPWWVYSFTAMAMCLWLGLRRLHAGAVVLAVLLTLETVIILILDLGILFGDHSVPMSQLSFEPFSPSATFSGAIGVALMFAHASFIGFEGTAIYGEEARDPKRTVPIATYIAVIFMGVFYALTAWLIINAIGTAEAVAVAKDQSGNLIFWVSDKILGGWATELFQVLVITSLFAAIVTFHSNVARYLYSLGRQGLLSQKLGSTHPVQKSPHVACYVQTAMVAVVVAIFAVLGLNPYDTLFTWFTGVGAAGIITIQCIASIAIFVFFRRSTVDKRLWHTFVAPLLSVAGLLPFLYFALTSFDVLLGVQGALELFFMALLFGSFALGFLGAFYLSVRSPEKYSRLESSLGDQV